MGRCCFLALLPALCLAASPPETVEIAPGVDLPLLNDGVSNRTVWIQAGGKGIDTALMYGDADQKQVGQAVVASGRPRSELFVTSKIPCCPAGESAYGQSKCKSLPQWQNVTAAIQHEVEALSLGGLQQVDLLLMHFGCDTLERTVEVYSRMEALVASGWARAIGVSNFNATLLEALVTKTTIKPAVNQVSFSIGGHSRVETPTGHDDVTLAKCKELGVTLSAWAPLGHVSGIDVLHEPHVVAVAASHNRSTAQIALRWLVQQGIPAVTSTNSPGHAASDLAVYDFELSAQEMDMLSSVPPPPSDPNNIHDTVLVV